MKKYKLTTETKYFGRRTLYRIQALKDFADVKAGELGGWIEKEENLSHNWNCWVYDEAIVCDNAIVCGGASVSGRAIVQDNSIVEIGASVRDEAIIRGDTVITGQAVIKHCAEIHNYACIGGNAVVEGSAVIYDYAKISGDTNIAEYASVGGVTNIKGDAIIKSDRDYITIKNNWSSGKWITYTHSNKKWNVGCFHGTSKDLIKKAYAESKSKGKCYKLTVKYVEDLYKAMEKEDNDKENTNNHEN